MNDISTAAHWQSIDARHAALHGELTVATATKLRREGRRAMRGVERRITVDLAGVTAADSAGVALLIDWLAWANAQGAQIEYLHLPESVTALAGLSDVLPLLAVSQGVGDAGGDPGDGPVGGESGAGSASVPKSSGGTSPS